MAITTNVIQQGSAREFLLSVHTVIESGLNERIVNWILLIMSVGEGG